VNSATVDRLLDLNRRFYEDRGRDFSATRLRLQPGVKRLLQTLHGDESVLDLGCGNGELARSLSGRGHRGSYLGLDFSPILLAEAGGSSFGFPVRFVHCDLSQPSWDHAIADASAGAPSAHIPSFEVIFCFAVLHHVPSASLRSGIVCKIHDLLAADGRFILSTWRFTDSPRMSGRIQPWSAAGLTAEEVDPHDYVLDWKRGGQALRYVHQFDESELGELSGSTGFALTESFYADGADRKSSIYQVWRKSQG
jgi:tRNA (uracil-5-)-methyltransferase TRM9